MTGIGTMSTATDININYGRRSTDTEQVVALGRTTSAGDTRTAVPERHSLGVFAFITELRRRRVCRAATVYTVTMWLVAQVVEVIAEPLGLPEWTLKLVIVLGLIGFPIALILSWLLEITPQGVVRDPRSGSTRGGVRPAEPVRPLDRIIDCGLLAIALVIGAQLAFAEVPTAETDSSDHRGRIVAVGPFKAASGDYANELSAGLHAELQHQLTTRGGLKVVGHDTAKKADRLTLEGTVAMNDSNVRVTVIAVESDSGAVVWSKVVERPRTDALTEQVEVADAIASSVLQEWRDHVGGQPNGA